MQCGIIESQFAKGFTQIFVIFALDRIQTGKYPRLHFLETGQGCCGAIFSIGQRITDLRRIDILDPGNHKPHITSIQAFSRERLRRKYTYFFDLKNITRAHGFDFPLRQNCSVDDTHKRNDAYIVIKPGINNQCL